MCPLSAPDEETLRSLGLTTRQRAATHAPAAALVALVGSGLAVVVAIALAPLMPFGVARRADPDIAVAAMCATHAQVLSAAPPELIATTPDVRPDTLTGVERLVVVPSPSAPTAL